MVSVSVRFLKEILLVTLLMALVLAYPATAWMNDHQQSALLASAIMAFANIVLGYIILVYAIDKPHAPLMIAVFGGMGVRMALILVVLAMLLVDGYDPLTLSLSFMGFYVVFMVTEIRMVLSEMGTRGKRPAASTRALRSRTESSERLLFETERN